MPFRILNKTAYKIVILICSSLQFFTSGGGSKAWKGKSPYRTCEDNKFYYDGQGFMTLELTRAEAKIRFYDVSGQVLYNLDLSKNQYSAM